MIHPELTPMENKVLNQLLLGKTNQLISEELGISINTVKTHLKHIFKKRNVHSRIELILSNRPTSLRKNPKIKEDS